MERGGRTEDMSETAVGVNADVDAITTALSVRFRASADRERATGMAAYMRGRYPFLGIATPPRRALQRQAFGRGAPTPEIALGVAAWCWELPEREYQYAAADLLRRVAGDLPATALGEVRGFVTTRSWWDTVDTLASGVVGPMVATHPILAADMDRWITDDDLWVARTAILHQLASGPATDTDRLFRYCRAQAGHPDFFIRKAIGWALRQYARTDAGAVRAFLSEHGDELSPLSVREGSKHLAR